jgi:hypothetical protein
VNRRREQKPMTDLARDRQCYIRFNGCLPGTETVVFAHLRMMGISGMGYVAPPILGCPACYHCHEIADRRAFMANLTADEVRLAHLEGVARWINTLIQEDKLTW